MQHQKKDSIELIGILIFPGIRKIDDIILYPPAIFNFQSARPDPASSSILSYQKNNLLVAKKQVKFLKSL
jgi:hypothetical protein